MQFLTIGAPQTLQVSFFIQLDYSRWKSFLLADEVLFLVQDKHFFTLFPLET